jgi:predicted CXXCH cytochrome family protein
MSRPQRASLVLLAFALGSLGLTGGAQAPRRAAQATTPRGDHSTVVAGDDKACIGCHPAVMQHEVLHGPVAAAACEACHTVTKAAGTVTIGLVGGVTKESAATLCLQCHNDVAERMQQGHVHAPVAAGTCTVCHDPHGSAHRFMLAATGKEACLRCHADIADELTLRFPHEPAATSCAICHDPHGTKYAGQTRAGMNTLCLTCHYDAPPVSSAEGPIVFERVALPFEAQLASKGRRIGLDSTQLRGHPMMRHPVSGPDDPAHKGQPFTCISCHAVHGAPTRAQLRFDAGGVSSLCIKCHQF